MAAPILKMTQGDVQIAIARQFQKDLKILTFTKGQKFGAVDPSSNKSFILQRQFTGEGEYDFNGLVGLFNEDLTFATSYRLNGRVSVKQQDGVPQISFIGTISYSKL